MSTSMSRWVSPLGHFRRDVDDLGANDGQTRRHRRTDQSQDPDIENVGDQMGTAGYGPSGVRNVEIWWARILSQS